MNIKIRTDLLEKDIYKLKEKVQLLASVKEGMYQCLDELNGMWDGPASIVFMTQTKIDKFRLERLIHSIEHFIECMEYANSQYIKCSEDIDSKIASIKISGDS